MSPRAGRLGMRRAASTGLKASEVSVGLSTRCRHSRAARPSGSPRRRRSGFPKTAVSSPRTFETPSGCRDSARGLDVGGAQGARPARRSALEVRRQRGDGARCSMDRRSPRRSRVVSALLQRNGRLNAANPGRPLRTAVRVEGRRRSRCPGGRASPPATSRRLPSLPDDAVVGQSRSSVPRSSQPRQPPVPGGLPR